MWISCWFLKFLGDVCANGGRSTDLAIYFMPIRKMYHLRVPRRQKMMLVGIFSLGAMFVPRSSLHSISLALLTPLASVCMASIFRIPATIRSMGSYDVTWHMWVSLIWTDLETGIGIVVACLPSLTPILIRFMGRHEPKEVQKNYVNRPGTRFKNTMARAFPNHIYPQAQITTTVTATARENWYGWESEEETIRRVPNHGHEDEESGGDDAGEKLETGVMLVETTRSITRTTVIEQTVSECCGSSKAGVPYTRS